ncbi:hypothetical protein [Candidatus Vampirococcus lugosii]|uniref:hypothetical protein n=1 Tax=Candidatus Vampirococcus lugosii TaxID=2789015 RepID=UPI001BCFA24E|nr:hypothetical protein [Candidatus Vampirococcus lugosii]
MITNNYCDLNDNNIKSNGWDYICFTDNRNIKSKFWKIIYIDNNSKNEIDHIKLSKEYKTQVLKHLNKYGVYLYIDGRIKIIKDINEYLKRLDNKDIVFMKHRQKSIKDQFNVIVENKYDKKEIIEKIKERHKEFGYEYNNGLIEGGVILFKNNERVKKFFDDWWFEIKNYSHRDQLSANFAIFLNPELKYLITKNPIYDSPKYFSLLKRKKSRFKIK